MNISSSSGFRVEEKTPDGQASTATSWYLPKLLEGKKDEEKTKNRKERNRVPGPQATLSNHRILPSGQLAKSSSHGKSDKCQKHFENTLMKN